MSNNKGNGGGYGKPPHSSRWKKGQSGNPKGRPKKGDTPSWLSNERWNEIVMTAGLQPMEFIERGVKKTATKLDLMLTQMSTKAAAGDLKAIALYAKLVAAATLVKDKMRHEWIMTWTDMQDDLLKVQNKKGTFEFFRVMHKYYMFKKNMRRIEGDGRWPWEPGEPLTTEDWVMFLDYYEALKRRSIELAPWPLDYPSDKPSKEELKVLEALKDEHDS